MPAVSLKPTIRTTECITSGACVSILSIRLTNRLNESLNEEARLSRQPKSLIARIALEHFLANRQRERFLAQMTRAAKAIDPDHAVQLAEEALPLDNESMARVEKSLLAVMGVATGHFTPQGQGLLSA